VYPRPNEVVAPQYGGGIAASTTFVDGFPSAIRQALEYAAWLAQEEVHIGQSLTSRIQGSLNLYD
jgi:hypothetical protein